MLTHGHINSLYRLVKAKKLKKHGRGKFRVRETNGVEQEETA